MRKLILQMQMSVDRFFSPGRDLDWQLWDWGENSRWDDELKRDFNAHMEGVDTILLSRKMAEDGYLAHWEAAARRYPEDPFLAFAKRVGEVQKVVPTNKLATSRWERTSVRPGYLRQVVNALKSEEGADIAVFGGVGFASGLVAAGLVDQYQFYINPAVLGAGLRIFGEGDFQRIKLVGSKAYGCGMVVNRYEPAGPNSSFQAVEETQCVVKLADREADHLAPSSAARPRRWDAGLFRRIHVASVTSTGTSAL